MMWNYIKPLYSFQLVEEFEKMYCFQFPKEYKTVVLYYNGSRPDKTLFPTSVSKVRSIKTLLSFNKNDKETIWNIMEWNREELDNTYIPFGIDNFGNLICFQKDTNSIIFLNIERNMTEFVCNNFKEFLEKLF